MSVRRQRRGTVERAERAKQCCDSPSALTTGLMAIHYIAIHDDLGAVSAKRIAEEFSIPPELLAKILQRLAKERLIVSQNGPKGGYVLARRPAEITRGRGDPSARGPDQHRELPGGASDCPQMERCNLRRPVQKIQAAITQVLDTMSLAELASDGRRRSCLHDQGVGRETRTDGAEVSDLHGRAVDDAGGPAGRRGDAAVLHREVRPSGQPQPPVRLGGGGGGRRRARAARQADRRARSEGARLHVGRHGVDQPRPQGRGRDVPREGQPHRHHRHRAAGRPRRLQAPRAPGLHGDRTCPCSRTA